MRRSRKWAATVIAVSAVTVTPLALSVATGAATGLAAAPRSGAATVNAHRVGTFQLAAGGATTGELRPPTEEDVAAGVRAVANRSPNSHAKAVRGTPPPSGVTPTQTLAVSTPGDTGWRGINHREQRLADGGNQWSLVPPDQGLCTNGTQIVEAVNNALAVYSTGGGTLTPLRSLNELFWQDHEVLRPDGIASPHQMGDPECVFDPGTGRFILTVYDAISDAAANMLGPTFVDIAVSPVGTAVGSWTTFTIDATNDGNHGTPSHPHCPCFPDYPHIGTDANALYISTNEYSVDPFGTYFNGANVYALQKSALTGASQNVPGVMFNTARTDLYKGVLYDGSTLAPARATGTAYPSDGTMYFLSSDAWSDQDPIVSEQILVWRLTGADTLGSDHPVLDLSHSTVAVNAYYPPPSSDQKVGTVPLADCLNDARCSRSLLGHPDRYKEYEYAFDSGDTRMLQSSYANGLLWGALDTAVDLPVGTGTVTKAGVAYYVVDPTNDSLVKQGTIAVPDNNISYPALGVTAAGQGVMAMTLTGKDYYPSAAYVRVDAANPAGDVTVVGTGLSPVDDFSGYRGYEYNFPRWGDYGAAAVVGGDVWIASDYIAQHPCSLSVFVSTNFTCNGERTSLANWATHIVRVTP